MVKVPPVFWGGRFNFGEVGLGGPWVSAVSALVFLVTFQFWGHFSFGDTLVLVWSGLVWSGS